MEIRRGVGNEQDGGYRMRFRSPCKVDFARMGDVEALEAFIAHQQRRCPCFPASHPGTGAP